MSVDTRLIHSPFYAEKLLPVGSGFSAKFNLRSFAS
jgi:hypothetical protein